jgi:adenylate cyclase
MADYSPTEAVVRAGVDPAYVERLLDLRFIRPDADDRLSKGDIRRIQMARTLEGAGLPLDGLAAAIRGGQLKLDFMDTAMYERFATLGDETFQQLADRTGIPLHLLTVIREATGSPAPEPGERVREDELAVVGFVAEELRIGFREVSIERFLRVAGEGMRRIAETESNAWRADREARLARGMGIQQAADEADALSENLDAGIMDAAMLDRPPAMCFLDITGYTRITQERGDEEAASLAERLGRLVNRSSLAHGGRAVKWLGDGVMFYFRDPGPGVIAALEMVDGVRDAGLPPAHVGLHAGPVLFQEGDYFGQTVNLASRIAEYARPGEVLVTQQVVDASADAGAFRGASFTEIGPVELKGVPEPVHLLSAHRTR